MCCTFSALVLFDEGSEVSADRLNKLIKASGNSVEAYWPQLFAKALQGRNLNDLLVGGAPAPQQSTTTASNAPAETKKEEVKKKEEPKKEEEVDLGGGLFGGDDW